MPGVLAPVLELELELTHTQMAKRPVTRISAPDLYNALALDTGP